MNRPICILIAGALAALLVNLAAGAADGKAGFSIPRAAEFLDANAHAFEKDCLACHVTFTFLMARPWRVEYPGAIYRVTFRGNQWKLILRSDADRQSLRQ